MTLKKRLFIHSLFIPVCLFWQFTFTNSSSLLVNASLTSGVAIGISEMNSNGLDDIVRLDKASSF